MSQQLTKDQAAALDAIGRLQPVAAVDVARELGRDRNMVRKDMRVLQTAGLIYCDGDGRGAQYFTTDAAPEADLAMPKIGQCPSVWAYAQGVAA